MHVTQQLHLGYTVWSQDRCHGRSRWTRFPFFNPRDGLQFSVGFVWSWAVGLGRPPLGGRPLVGRGHVCALYIRSSVGAH